MENETINKATEDFSKVVDLQLKAEKLSAYVFGAVLLAESLEGDFAVKLPKEIDEFIFEKICNRGFVLGLVDGVDEAIKEIEDLDPHPAHNKNHCVTLSVLKKIKNQKK